MKWKWAYSSNQKYTLANKLYQALGGAYYVNTKRYEEVFEVVRKSDRKKVVVHFGEVMPNSDEKRPFEFVPNAVEVIKSKF